jgi:hypothetical protein
MPLSPAAANILNKLARFVLPVPGEVKLVCAKNTKWILFNPNQL